MEELVQGSEKWLKWREGGLGSSDIATLMGLNPYKTCEQLFLEKTKQVIPEDISQKYAVKRGVELEPHARDLFNKISEGDYVPKTFIDVDDPTFRYSSDGWSKITDDIIEIKCTGIRNHELVLSTNKPIGYYLPQLQWGMSVSRTTKCWYVNYNPAHEIPIKALSVDLDEVFEEKMRTEAKAFWDKVLEFRHS